MHPMRQGAFDATMAHFTLARPAETVPGSVDPASFFTGLTPDDLWLEIGFGHGEHIVHQAGLNPQVGLLGIEPFLNGIATAALAIQDTQVENIRIYPDDALHLLPLLQDASFSRIFLFFPDPWPKVRHFKRRFIQPHTVAILARLLKPGGTLHLATDIPSLAEWMVEHVLAHGDFAWHGNREQDQTTPPAVWVTTKYQQKAIREGRSSAHFDFVKKPV